MAEEDEIDILGEFNLGNFLSKNNGNIYDTSETLVSQNADILNCDFTIHPQWLLDKPSANPDNWYDTNNLSMSLLERSQLETDSLGQTSTENSITDESGWTEKEKNLLERGIDIFGKSNVRLAQFIGSKTPSEVRYYLKNFYLENHSHDDKCLNDGFTGDICTAQLADDVLDDTQIPASMEEVIAAVSTAKPTIPFKNNQPKKENYYQTHFQAASSRLKAKSPLESAIKIKKRVKDMKMKNKAQKIKYKFRQENKNMKLILMEHKPAISNIEIDKRRDPVIPLCDGEEIIRNTILKNWRSVKPKYLTKTTCRCILKKSGDVNSIGRIHTYLEQIGAINFGCEQVVYERPLFNFVYVPPASKEKAEKRATAPRVSTELGVRQRVKNKKFTNDGDGGCTLTHDEKGQIVNTTVVNEEPKQKLYIKRPVIKLIYCRPFTAEKPQPYKVKINLATLLTIDFHAHACLTEVMGLVAGSWIPQENLLKITHYEPCLNIASSTTHCDMCPISQAKAADLIHQKELDILGWFHSHPTFAPEPSQQDLDTQRVVQQWIGYGKPCLGVILSPFTLSGALIASPFRCLIVDERPNFEDLFVPYRFKVDIDPIEFQLSTFLEDLRRVHEAEVGCSNERRVDFNKPYSKESKLSYLDKYITSVRMHLARCGIFASSACDKIEQGILSVFD
ncbi:unnamed protein product [Acanthoscelides obtectus]|uniref:Myb-like, SWIRM and MPN domain-containing protein 1 n=1 Tax=Acanthoscelides obtectus TaxID=200917 RepID=A0A9P0KNP4_ACAOB|nr:unnamed protein product [Acanthoscelides obtectus]CAK1623715.1 Histone H2A deubiquitinase MYSM1 [Acanthoscelides obtectus]